MNERIKKIRQHFDLTQKEFAEKLGLSTSVIACYENATRTPGNAILLSICRVYGVQEKWLRTGTGDMFSQSDDDAYLQIVRALGPNRTRLAHALLRLMEICSEDDALNIINECLDNLDKPVTIPASEYARLKKLEKKEQQSTESREDAV